MIFHYVECDYIDGNLGGVPRFDNELRKVFPDMITISKKRRIPYVPTQNDIVITGNDLCLEIPNDIKCIVVHHGIAETHKLREPTWAGDKYVIGQRQMKDRPNTYFVSPSKFCTDQFREHHRIEPIKTIIHSSSLGPIEHEKAGINILGDWRNFNKGKEVIETLKTFGQYNFIQLECGADDKEEAYSKASIYLTLSLSEGCSYSQLDAIACDIPVLSTDVSLFGGDCDERCGEVISYKDRNNVNIILDTLEDMIDNYDKYRPREWLLETMTFDKWTQEWKDVVNHVRSL